MTGDATTATDPADLGVVEMRTVDAIVAAMAAAGITHVFGMPGGMTVPIWTALHEHPQVTPVIAREESIGSMMAEAAARLSGSPTVVMGQGEWIVGNAGQGVLEALLGSAPLVVITEMSDGGAFSHHSPYQSGTGDYGTWDAATALRGVCKRVFVSRYPAQAVQHVQLAVRHAMTGDPGPVAVVLATDSLRGHIGPATRPRPTATVLPDVVRRPSVDREQSATAARAIDRAARPVILAGNGVRVGRATEHLVDFAEHIGAPVATTPGGKGVFDERHPLALGVIGPHGWPGANETVGAADAVIVVGSRLSSSDTLDHSPDLLDPERQLIVQIDTEPLHLGGTVPIGQALLGDAAPTLTALTALTTARVATVSGRPRGTTDTPSGSTAPPFGARAVIEAIATGAPDDAVVTCDAGENRLFMMRWFHSRGRGRDLQPAGGGGMGYAGAAALGARIAEPSLPAIAVCGDGGFSMSLHALMTAVDHDLPITVIVLDNGGLGWVLHGSRNRVADQFRPTDVVAVARALGCEAARIDSLDNLVQGLREVGGQDRPRVLHVPLDPACSFRDVLYRPEGDRAATGY
jgi:acetolactate synthase-1/2/3 large subunit